MLFMKANSMLLLLSGVVLAACPLFYIYSAVIFMQIWHVTAAFVCAPEFECASGRHVNVVTSTHVYTFELR